MRRKQDLKRNGCLKNGKHVPAFSNSFVYRFPELVPMCRLPPVGGACPERGDLRSPRANLHQYSNVSVGTQLQSFSRGKEGHHNLLHETHSKALITVLAYLVAEDQSAPQKVRGVEREANSWCLQLQRQIVEKEEAASS